MSNRYLLPALIGDSDWRPRPARLNFSPAWRWKGHPLVLARQRRVQLPQFRGVYLDELAVVSHEPVHFAFHVRGLGVDCGRNTEFVPHRNQGHHLLAHAFRVGGLILVGLVAPVAHRWVPEVVLHRPADATVLAQPSAAASALARRCGCRTPRPRSCPASRWWHPPAGWDRRS